MEPPSPALSAALRDLRLATPRDIRRAASRCRSIARDLPAFDCVWIDSLLGLGRLTSFQAARLQEGEAHLLRIGLYVLLDRLGGGADGTTYLAKPLEGGPRCVLKRLTVAADLRATTRARLDELCAAGRALRLSNPLVPDAVFEDEGRLIVLSRYVEGDDGRVRLMRSGRLPAGAVAEIARQLLAALAQLHRIGLAHGDIRLSNLRLTPRGEALLVDCGVRPAVSPALPIDDSRPPEWYDGMAPERIGTTEPATAASDAYSLGCLLWHLLAGRPPFATGDPLAKLAAHRSRPLPDVRDYAADVPPQLAALIAGLTDLDPSRRVSECGEARARLRGAGRSARRQLRRPGAGASVTRFPWSVAAAILFAVSGASYSLLDHGGTAALLKTTLGRTAGESSTADALAGLSLAGLPPADEAGVVALEHAGPFAAADIAFQGALVLRGRPERPATIVVTDRPLHLWADDVALEHVRIVHSESQSFATVPPALVLIEAQNVSISSCRFESPTRAAAGVGTGPPAVAWRLLDRADPTAGRLEVQHTVFRGGREAVFAGEGVRRLTAENVLAVGHRCVFSLAGDCTIAMTNVTVREANAVVACRTGATPGRIAVEADDSILDLGPAGELIAEADGISELRWSGSGVFTPDELSLAGDEDEPSPRTAGDAAPGSRIEGITRAVIAFAGPATGSDAASVARVTGAPRIADRPPGVDLSRLPREVVGLDAPR